MGPNGSTVSRRNTQPKLGPKLEGGTEETHRAAQEADGTSDNCKTCDKLELVVDRVNNNICDVCYSKLWNRNIVKIQQEIQSAENKDTADMSKAELERTLKEEHKGRQMVDVLNEVEMKFAGIICPYQLNIPLSPM